MTGKLLITFNAGSSTVKIGLFALEKRLKDPLINAFWNRQG